jgi:tetratricopeptide (TPR) repeat protein
MALAEVTGYLGRRREAIPLFEKAISEFIRTRGENHVMVAQARLKMALVLINDGRLADADRALEAAYRTFAALGHFDAASCLRMLGNSLLAQGRYEEAIGRYEEAIQRFQAEVGPQHMLTLVARGNLGTAQVRLGRLAEGRATLDAVIADLTAISGPESDTLRQPLLSRGEAERKAGRPRQALAYHRRAQAIAEVNVGPNHVGVANALREIALDFEALGSRADLAEARTAIERAIAIRSAGDPNASRLADCYDDAERITRALGDVEAARAAKARAVELRATGG